MWCKSSNGETCDRCGQKIGKGRRLCVTEQDRAKELHRLMSGHRIRIPSPQLGDKVQSFLTGIGITEDRVKKFFGVKDCGCSGRKKTLNDVSEELAYRLESVANKALDFFIGDMVSEESERMARNITQRMRGNGSSLPDK
jgi:hypothetical protein